MKRMWKALAAGALTLAVMALGLAGSAEAQMAKSGKINGVYSWHFKTGSMSESGENRNYWTGTSWGMYQAGDGQGPLHRASVVCTSAWDLNGGASAGSGTCTITDPAGDKAYYHWKGGAPANAEWTAGDGEFAGGTGKFKGIAGKVNWKHKIIAVRDNFGQGEGFSIWEGEFRLP
jgi:hypothetical protein